MGEIIIYKSRLNALKAIFTVSPLVFIAACLFYFQVANFIAWISISLFTAVCILCLYNIFDRRPQIIINETGIFDRTGYKDFINWNAIDHAYWATIHRQQFVCLILKEEFKDLVKGNSKMKKLNLTLGFQEVNISLASVRNVDQEKLTALIINLANANPVDRSRMLTGYTLNTK